MNARWLFGKFGATDFAVLAIVLLCGFALPADAAGDDPRSQLFSEVDLDDLVGRIALYPDDLIAIILPAATDPVQIVQAARFLEARQQDATLEPDPDWNEAVLALLNYPDVLEMLDEDLDWTADLGEAVLVQETGLMNAVQRFRDRAYASGNLRSDQRQIVSRDSEIIEIRPANPDVIYVPRYEPARVIVRRSYPVYYDYDWIGYPVYYYPYSLRDRYYDSIWGFNTFFSLNWRSHSLFSHRRDNPSHPYYGRNFNQRNNRDRDWNRDWSDRRDRDNNRDGNRDWNNDRDRDDRNRNPANVNRSVRRQNDSNASRDNDRRGSYGNPNFGRNWLDRQSPAESATGQSIQPQQNGGERQSGREQRTQRRQSSRQSSTGQNVQPQWNSREQRTETRSTMRAQSPDAIVQQQSPPPAQQAYVPQAPAAQAQVEQPRSERNWDRGRDAQSSQRNEQPAQEAQVERQDRQADRQERRTITGTRRGL